MKWLEFIFSEKKPVQYTRHIIFWVVWWFYFYGSRYFYPKVFLSGQTNLRIPADQKLTRPLSSFLDNAEPWSLTEGIRSFFMIAIHISACYIIIYFLLRYLLRARYLLFLSGVVLLIFTMIQASRFIDTTVMPTFIDKNYYMPYYSSIFNGVISAIKIVFLAVAIKLGKHWWFQQKEKERFEKEKIDAELQLLKSQIHPQFLFSTLNNIYSFAVAASPKSPEMLLKLSDILSYMLYECNDKEVPLDKEIKILRDYIVLEKLRYGKKMEMNVQIKGNTNKDKIAPLLLLRFVENSFQQNNNDKIEQPWINLDILVENHVLEMKLMNGKTIESTSVEHDEENNLAPTAKRLQMIYPGCHELKIKEEPEIMIITLQLQLIETAEKTETLYKEITDTLRMPGVFS